MMKKWISLLTAVCVLTSMAACGEKAAVVSSNEVQTASSTAQTADTPSSKSTSEKKIDYQAALDKAVGETGFEGVTFVSKNGEMIAKSASGSDEDEEDSAVSITTDSLFCIGSATQQFTAAAVMLLKESGELDVEDSISKYFPEYEIGRDITIKNLLTMRSGIPEYYYDIDDEGNRIPIDESDNDNEYYDYDYYDEEESAATSSRFEIYAESDAYNNKLAINDWIFNQPLNFAPDTAYEFSSSNYYLLSQIVEIVSDTDFHTYIKEKLFDPAGMSKTGFLDELYDSPELVRGDKKFGISAYPGVTWGAADIVTCGDDMDKWLNALKKNTLLSKTSFNEMTANYSDGEEDMGYGYGFMLDTDGSISQTGEIGSYISYVYMNSSKDYHLFAVTNNERSMDGEFEDFTAKVIADTMK